MLSKSKELGNDNHYKAEILLTQHRKMPAVVSEGRIPRARTQVSAFFSNRKLCPSVSNFEMAKIPLTVQVSFCSAKTGLNLAHCIPVPWPYQSSGIPETDT